ncbi:hypothetical protein DICPUDRAFT_45603 [Dictyostelium purpureum]|uniref:Zinc transporter n=1 Tax=Dictyostelium purpureum TaxID=5786 RepID=F0ZB10_DICPU|nr:uncharacterized protein DICPUDRAFT_45603 [Dictyostelium purpureum]EGC38891.1 hypothetical protein DICPUDRAFT_45603 [Dictyostelium purpureum]|eukprot:XP_003284571.1 hypothetical protein DICPUDRAFT_45603 [Dictyostelium purpureum]
MSGGDDFGNNSFSNSIGGGLNSKFSRYAKNGSQQLVLMLFGAKGIRSWVTIMLFYLLQSLSVINVSFYMLLFSTIQSLITEKPWNLLSQLRPSQIKKIIYYSLFNLFIVLTWNCSVKYIGPLGTILASDYSYSTYPIIFGTLLQGNFLSTDMSRASIMLIFGYLLIPFFGGSKLQIHGYSASQVFMIGIFSLLIHNILVMVKKTAVKGWSNSHRNKLSSLGSLVATIVLFVLKMFESWSPSNHPVYIDYNQVSYYQLLQLVIVSVILLSFNQLTEDVSEQQLGFLVLSKASLTSTLLFGFIIAIFIGFYDFFSPILILSFVLIITAIHILYSKSNNVDQQSQVTFKTPIDGSSSIKTFNSSHENKAGYYLEIAKDVIRQIIEKPVSRRIFTFLIINLMFMFVEMAYGIWTNSLGLITDACHMLFDATALFIALVAEVISQWKQNDTYSYGYGRVQVLSGFVNGIFLIFIAVTILMESIERLLEPPEINTDKLLLVSVLGFLVNLVGIFSFHGDHGHSHGGGGGHTHGHSHGGEKKKSHDDHGHSHGGSSHAEEPKKKRSVNIDGVFLHLLADTLGSVGVIVSSLIIQIWGYTLADPICSLCISILIFLSVLPLIKGTAKTLLQCTPDSINSDIHQITQKILGTPGVTGLLNYHFWSHYDEMNIATLKIQVDSNADNEKIKKSISKFLKHDYSVHKTLIEFVNFSNLLNNSSNNNNNNEYNYNNNESIDNHSLPHEPQFHHNHHGHSHNH